MGKKRGEKIVYEKRAIRKAAEHQPKVKASPDVAVCNEEPVKQIRAEISLTPKEKRIKTKRNFTTPIKSVISSVPATTDSAPIKIIHASSIKEPVAKKAINEQDPIENKTTKETPIKIVEPQKTVPLVFNEKVCAGPTKRSDMEIEISVEEVKSKTGHTSNTVPSAPFIDRRKLKDFLRKKKYKAVEKREDEFITPEIQRLANLTRGGHNNASVIEKIKKRIELAKIWNKNAKRRLEQTLRKGTENEFRATRNIFIHKFTEKEWATREKVAPNKTHDNQYKVPDMEEAARMLRKWCTLKGNLLEANAEVMIRMNRMGDNYARILSNHREKKDLLRCIRGKRSNERFGNNILRKQVKLMECTYGALSVTVPKEFSKGRSTDLKSWRRKLSKYEFVRKRLEETSDKMISCVVKKQCEVLDNRDLLLQSKKERTVRERELEEANLQFEKSVVASDLYVKSTEKSDELNLEIDRTKKQHEEDKVGLQELKHQLKIFRNTPKNYDYLVKRWVKLQELVSRRSQLWIERQKKQEILKEMIRIKTGVILREEIQRSSLLNELEKLKQEKSMLNELLEVTSFQRRKFIFKYEQHFVNRIPANNLLLSSQ